MIAHLYHNTLFGTITSHRIIPWHAVLSRWSEFSVVSFKFYDVQH